MKWCRVRQKWGTTPMASWNKKAIVCLKSNFSSGENILNSKLKPTHTYPGAWSIHKTIISIDAINTICASTEIFLGSVIFEEPFPISSFLIDPNCWGIYRWIQRNSGWFIVFGIIPAINTGRQIFSIVRREGYSIGARGNTPYFPNSCICYCGLKSCRIDCLRVDGGTTCRASC